MSFQLSEAAREKLAARKELYLASLDKKRAELERLTAPVLAGELDEDNLEPLRQAVHKIAGSAGLYGLPDLQHKAASLDLALLNLGGQSSTDLADLVAALFVTFDAI